MTPIDFQPSDIHLDPSLPLCSTLGRAERELAAAYLVLTLRHLGAGWDRAVTFDELRAAVLVHSVDPRCRWLVGATAAAPATSGMTDWSALSALSVADDDAPQHVRNAAGRVPMSYYLEPMETPSDAFLVSSTCY